jgi:hypothetical protein
MPTYWIDQLAEWFQNEPSFVHASVGDCEIGITDHVVTVEEQVQVNCPWSETKWRCFAELSFDVCQCTMYSVGILFRFNGSDGVQERRLVCVFAWSGLVDTREPDSRKA